MIAVLLSSPVMQQVIRYPTRFSVGSLADRSDPECLGIALLSAVADNGFGVVPAAGPFVGCSFALLPSPLVVLPTPCRLEVVVAACPVL